MLRLSVFAVVAGLAVLASPALAGDKAHVLDNGRVHIAFGDSAYGPAVNANRFDVITWVKSDGTITGNFPATGGPAVCDDTYETFGEARGDDTAEEPRFIVAGTRAKWKTVTGGLVGTTKTSTKVCSGTVLAGTAASSYSLFTAAARINLLKVKRSFTFNGTSGTTNNLRPFMPRLADASYDTVLVPDTSGALQTYSAANCDGSCNVTNWSGRFLADDDGAGNGLMVLRDPSSNLPAEVLLDHDGWSDSNASAILLTAPNSGWSGTITEIEYLCFYDATSWTPAARAAGKLPKGCAVPGL